MKLTIPKLIYGLVLLGLTAVTAAIAWFAFYPSVPKTTEAQKGFYEMTGTQPSEVSDVYYDSSSDFHGDYSKYLRFTYPNDEWLDRFLSRRTNLSPAKSLRCSGPGHNWWDASRVYQLSEFYEQWPGPMPCVSMAIDRQQRHVYLCYFTY